ncbi:MAG TPA: methyltransferase [Gemmatimonadaceae bacterium]|nr:methyltransferase [Gemmatimonadaceae bacterium]
MTTISPAAADEGAAANAGPAASVWRVEPFRDGTPEEFARLRSALERAGYTEPALCARFGIAQMHEFLQAREGREESLEPTDAQAVLARLFLDAEPLEWRVVRALLPADAVAAIEALGLLHDMGERGELCAATVLLYPTDGLYIVSDRNADPDALAVPPPADIVYPAITRNTHRFMSTLPRTPCDSFLELCSGTGVAALAAAAGFARRAWAVDITGRATRFARFNAALNGLANVEALEGDLFEPVRGLTFDRIAAHPPYMPALRQEYVFRDGGEDGEQITRRIIAGLPEYLRPGGLFVCSCMATDRGPDAPLEARVREMLGAQQEEFDVVVAQAQTFDPTGYYVQLAVKGSGRFGPVETRHQLFKRLGITRLVFGTVMIQRHAAGARRPAFTARRQLGLETAAPQFEWLLRWATAEAATGYEALANALLDARPRANPGVELRMTYRLERGDGPAWTAGKNWVAVELPFAVEAECPFWVPALLERADGSATFRELLESLKRTGLVPEEASEAEFGPMALRFVMQGFLDVAEVPAHSG